MLITVQLAQPKTSSPREAVSRPPEPAAGAARWSPPTASSCPNMHGRRCVHSRPDTRGPLSSC